MKRRNNGKWIYLVYLQHFIVIIYMAKNKSVRIMKTQSIKKSYK